MTILETIVEHKRAEVADRRRTISLSQFYEMEYFTRPAFSLQESLLRTPAFAIIAEIKRSSPTAGVFRANIDPGALAKEYGLAGAAAISCLTDHRFFNGSLEDLMAVRAAIRLPVLRKDFIIHEFQLFEAKAYGADAVLLIATILDKSQLADLHAAAKGLGLECLVELYHEKEIDILDFGAINCVGINNRNLRTFEVNLNHSIEIARNIPNDVTIVSESGMTRSRDLQALLDHGIRAALIGEHFMKSDHPGEALRQLLEGLTNASQG